jgi:hypothetical protein
MREGGEGFFQMRKIFIQNRRNVGIDGCGAGALVFAVFGDDL